QIEESTFVNLADGGAVCAFHIVGEDFQLGFAIDLRLIRKQKIPVGLLGIGFLRVSVNNDAPMKDAVSMLIENSVVKLTALAMGTPVLYKHVVIEVFAARA